MLVSVHRINEVLDAPVRIQNGTATDVPRQSGGRVEFRHVSFRYPGAGEDVLHDISFTAEPGQTVAFIGATGSGKTTLLSLIPRFYDATSGDILVDGVNVRDYDVHTLRDRLGYVRRRRCCFPARWPPT